MENLGSGRKSFSLLRRRTWLYKTMSQARGEVEIFRPYEENLPLESGYYSFVVDKEGQFRIRRGNTSSHSAFVKSEKIGGAGHFRINRAGNVAEVFCLSLEYGIEVEDEKHPTVGYVIESFCNHHALEVSPLAVFRFRRVSNGTFYVSIDGKLIDDPTGRLKLLDEEGQGETSGPDFTPDQLNAYEHYNPVPPPKLYSMHRDQLIIALESDEDAFEFGPPKPRYAPDQPVLTSGKKAFVIDREGWLIFGFGHHILSGGANVGSAGQVVVEPGGEIGEINLNFSGHYRPALDAEYARYTFRSLENHPLLKLSPECRITGRKFDGLDVHSTNLKFTAEELRGDDPELEDSINYISF